MSTINWLKPADLYTIVCRPALPKDTPDVLELTRTIWEGDDYVPHVWAEWLRDYEGLLAVAEYGGRVVGLDKLSLLAPGEWWLEGLRVHPEYEGRGVASRLNDYTLDFWENKANGVVRLATVSGREPVKHLSTRSGFRVLGEFTFFKAPVTAHGVSVFRSLSINDVGAALDYALKSPAQTFTYGLMDLGWQWAGLSGQLLTEAAERGQAWWWEHPVYGLGLLVGRDDFYEGKVLYIQSIFCDQEAMLSCLQDTCSLAAASGYEKVGWIAPLRPELAPILDQASFIRDWDESILIYEKEHPVR